MLDDAGVEVLLVSSGLLVKGYMNLRASDRGFDSANVLSLRVSAIGTRYPDDAAVAQQATSGEQSCCARRSTGNAAFAASPTTKSVTAAPTRRPGSPARITRSSAASDSASNPPIDASASPTLKSGSAT